MRNTVSTSSRVIAVLAVAVSTVFPALAITISTGGVVITAEDRDTIVLLATLCSEAWIADFDTSIVRIRA